MPEDDKVKTRKRYKLSNGNYTYDVMAFRKDKVKTPTRGDYDPRTDKPSTGSAIKKGDVETVVLQKETPKALGVRAKKITKKKSN
jgi:hypothetical protein